MLGRSIGLVMIIHKLIARHLRHRDDPDFYRFQAQDAIRWMERHGLIVSPGMTVLDLGCGHGVFGAEFLHRGCPVAFADYANSLLPGIPASQFRCVNIDSDDLAELGAYDLVICSNVFEHLANPQRFLATVARLLRPEGWLYLSWTNWLSPWGGHEFSPFHYLGARRGHLIYDRWIHKPRLHTPYENLFPTYIGTTLKALRRHAELQVIHRAPRYYPEFAFLLRIPVAREFLAWNCALLIRRRLAPL